MLAVRHGGGGGGGARRARAEPSPHGDRTQRIRLYSIVFKSLKIFIASILVSQKHRTPTTELQTSRAGRNVLGHDQGQCPSPLTDLMGGRKPGPKHPRTEAPRTQSQVPATKKQVPPWPQQRGSSRARRAGVEGSGGARRQGQPSRHASAREPKPRLFLFDWFPLLLQPESAQRHQCRARPCITQSVPSIVQHLPSFLPLLLCLAGPRSMEISPHPS